MIWIMERGPVAIVLLYYCAGKYVSDADEERIGLSGWMNDWNMVMNDS